MPNLRGGLIGCGFFAPNHLWAWRDVEGAEISAVCDQDPARVAEYARRWEIPAYYSDPAAMLTGERLDFVDIVTPASTHRRLAELILGDRIPVICQKPMAPFLSDAIAMAESARRAGVPLMVHENFRWQHPMRLLNRTISEIGEPFWGRITWRSGYDVYADQPYLAQDERFIIADVGVHLLDLARFFLGEVDQLYAVTSRVNPSIRGEDSAVILLRMDSGAACAVELSYASSPETELFPQTLVELEGPAGRASLESGFRIAITRSGDTRRIDASPPPTPWGHPDRAAIQGSVVAIQQHWIDCLRQRRPPETSADDNLKTLAAVEAAYLSAERGLAVRLAELLRG